MIDTIIILTLKVMGCPIGVALVKNSVRLSISMKSLRLANFNYVIFVVAAGFC